MLNEGYRRKKCSKKKTNLKMDFWTLSFFVEQKKWHPIKKKLKKGTKLRFDRFKP